MKPWLTKIVSFLKNSLFAALKGEFLLRLNVGRYFVHIILVFVLFMVAIWTSLMIETSMSKIEVNNGIIKELQIANSQKVYDLERAKRRTVVEKNLQALGSEVCASEQNATIIDKR